MTFAECFDKTAGCWLWKTGKTGKGYGAYRPPGGKTMLAHRYSWELTYGKSLPSDVFLCHTCDNPCCVNPSHLVPGSCADNLKDAANKDRMAFGLRNANARYDRKLIESVIARRENGETLSSISRDTGMSMTHISDVCRGKARKKLAKEAT